MLAVSIPRSSMMINDDIGQEVHASFASSRTMSVQHRVYSARGGTMTAMPDTVEGCARRPTVLAS